MKKLLLILLASLMMASLFACKKDNAAATYNVTFSGAEVAAQTVEEGSALELPECNLEHFLGWSIDGKLYQPGAKYHVSGDTTVTALFEGTADLTFVYDKYEENTETKTYAIGEAIELPENTAEFFLGWSDGTKTYDAGDLYLVAEAATLTAQFAATADVTFGNGDPTTYAVGTQITLPATNVENKDRWQLNDDAIYNAGDTFTVETEGESYAFEAYESIKYTVYDWDGYEIASNVFKADSYDYFAEKYDEFAGYEFDAETQTAHIVYKTDNDAHELYHNDVRSFDFWTHHVVTADDFDAEGNGLLTAYNYFGVLLTTYTKEDADKKTEASHVWNATNTQTGEPVFEDYYVSFINESYVYLPLTYQGKPVTGVVQAACYTYPSSDKNNSADRRSAKYLYVPSTLKEIGQNTTTNNEYGAFEKNHSLAKVDFADHSTLTSIGFRAFYDTGLTSITLPSSLTHIYNQAFSGFNQGSMSGTTVALSKLSEVELNDGLLYIGNLAFAYSSLKTVSIPNSVVHIGDYAFQLPYHTVAATEDTFAHYEMTETEMETLKMPYQQDVILELGNSIFTGWGSIETVDWNGRTDVSHIKLLSTSGAVFNTLNLKEFKFLDYAVNDSTEDNYNENLPEYKKEAYDLTLWCNPFGQSTNMPTSHVFDYSLIKTENKKHISKLPTFAFAYDETLTEFNYNEFKPGFFQGGAEGAFYHCKNLTTVNMDIGENNGSTVHSINSLSSITFSAYMFAYSGLEKLEFDFKNSVNLSGSYAFMGCSKLKTLKINNQGASSGDIGLKGTSLFKDSALETVEIKAKGRIESTSATAHNSIFENCTSLTSVTMEALSQVSLTGNRYFFGCNQLATFTAKAGTWMTIGGGNSTSFFEGCSALTTINLESNNNRCGLCSTASDVTSDLSFFKGCTALTTINMKAGSGNIDTRAKNLFNTVIPMGSSNDRHLTLNLDTTSTAAGCCGYADMWGDADLSKVTINFREAQKDALSKKAGWNGQLGSGTITYGTITDTAA